MNETSTLEKNGSGMVSTVVSFIRTNSNCVMKGEKENRCKALQAGVCLDPATCAFHRTKEEKKKSEETWKKRMNSLSEDAQIFYSEQYYKGAMPWKAGVKNEKEKRKKG